MYSVKNGLKALGQCEPGVFLFGALPVSCEGWSHSFLQVGRSQGAVSRLAQYVTDRWSGNGEHTESMSRPNFEEIRGLGLNVRSGIKSPLAKTHL